MASPHQRASSARPLIYAPPSDTIEILHHDTDLLIVNKPAGLLSVPGKSADHHDCLESRLQASHPEARIVHRLDMATSGVMVLAMNKTAHRHLGLQFERRHIEKTYIALVDGEVTKTSGKIDLPLICDWPNRPLQKVCYETGKPALTRWEKLESDGKTTRLCLKPETGRSHQLRVHLTSIGHPILGDALYADDKAYEVAERLLLHAEQLKLHHPDGGAVLTFQVPCPF